MNVVEQFNRFENERNGCELLLDQSKLVEQFFSHSDMNNLLILIRFFRFLQQSLLRTRSNAIKLLLCLPGSKLLQFAYGHLKPSPSIDVEEKNHLENFVLIFSDVLQSLLNLHPHCWSQIESVGLFDRLEAYNQKHSVRKDFHQSNCQYGLNICFLTGAFFSEWASGISDHKSSVHS